LIGRLGVTSTDHGGGKRRAVTSSRQRPRFRLQPFADDAGALLAGDLMTPISSCAAGWRHLINFVRWIFELRSQSACVLGAQSNAGRKGLINTDCQ
jgi:hypothetical protein